LPTFPSFIYIFIHQTCIHSFSTEIAEDDCMVVFQ
jgi:hypothetical protein